MLDLPEEQQQVVKDLSHDLKLTYSETVIWLMRRGVGQRLEKPKLGVNEQTGFPTLDTGRLITSSEVERFLDEDE